MAMKERTTWVGGEGEDGREGEDNMGRWRGRGWQGRRGLERERTWVGRERMAGKERLRQRGRGWQGRRGQHG